MAARPLPKPARRVAIGIKRVSLLKQVGNYSFDGQGNKFAILEGKFDCSIPTELMIEDKGYSGTDFNRPSIKKAQNMIRAGVANAVAFPWVDRFARDLEGGLATIRQFRELGADILLGDLGWYQDSGWFKAQMHMFMMIAQYQRDDIADKSRWGVEAKLARGLAHFGAPFGWRMVTAREIAARALNAGLPVPLGKPLNFYERVLEDVDTLLLIGDLALAGGRDGSQKGICRELDARGILTPKAKRLLARGEGCISQWNSVSLSNYVYDEVYSTGIWHYGKREFVEPHPDRIRKPDAERHRVRSVAKLRNREEWDHKTVVLPGGPIWTPDEQLAIQEAIERNGQVSAGKPARRREDGGQEAILRALSGTCMATVTEGEKQGQECGMAIAPWQGHARMDGTRPRYYRCTHRHRTKNHHLCDAKSVQAEPLEAAIWERMKLAICEELADLVAAHFGKIEKPEDERVLAKLREEHKRKDQWRREAVRKEIEASADARKAEYAVLVAEYERDLALLDRRILAAANDGTSIEAWDIATIQRQARKAFEATSPAHRRKILERWLDGWRYGHGEAEITIRIELAAKGKSAEHAIYYKQPLYLTVNTRVAA